MRLRRQPGSGNIGQTRKYVFFFDFTEVLVVNVFVVVIITFVSSFQILWILHSCLTGASRGWTLVIKLYRLIGNLRLPPNILCHI